MATIDYARPLRLGFAFSCATDKLAQLIESYRDAGIPEADIDTIDANTLSVWQKNAWDISVYAKGSQTQIAMIAARGFQLELTHVLGPFKL